MTTTVGDWNTTQDLTDDKDALAYLNASAQDSDPAVLLQALGNVVKARGLEHIAQQVGMSAASLEKDLSLHGDPSLKIVLKVIRVFGWRMSFAPLTQS